MGASSQDPQLGSGGFSTNTPFVPLSADQQRSNMRNVFQTAYADSGGTTAQVNPDNFDTSWTDPYRNEAQQNFWASAGRATPQVDQQQIDNSQAQAALGQAQQFRGGQFQLARQLGAESMGIGGPSPAELAMRRSADANMRQQMAMAAGARGANAGAARLGAAQNAADISGQLQRDLGVQRAQERIDAREQLGQVLQQGRGMDLQTGEMAYGQAADAARFGFEQGSFNAGLQMQVRELDDAAYRDYLDRLYGSRQFDTQSQIGYEQLRTGNTLEARAIDKGVPKKSWAEENAPIIAGAAQTLGTVATAASDIRAKRDIRPASAETGDAYRAVFGRRDQGREDPGDTFRSLTPSRYAYKDPERHGEGEYIGPMAQQLEKTPAGRTVVSEQPDGTKAVDTSRLSLMSAGEIGDLRRELDEVQARQAQQAATVRGLPPATMPQTAQLPPWAQPQQAAPPPPNPYAGGPFPAQQLPVSADPYVARIAAAPGAAYPTPAPVRW